MFESDETIPIINASPHLSLEGFAASECQHENREKGNKFTFDTSLFAGKRIGGVDSSSAIYLKRKTEKKGSKPPPQHR